MSSMKTKQKPIEEFSLFVDETDDHGGFSPPYPLAALMAEVESFIDSDQVDEHNQGMYQALNEILSCPTACMFDKCVEILTTIIDESCAIEVEEEVSMACDMVKKVMGTEVRLPKGEVANLIIEDISDEDLLAEYQHKSEILYED